MDNLLKELSLYYQEKGIFSLDFHCRHWQFCSKDNKRITQAKSAFVGTEYEKAILPRLLFISLDPGDSDSEPERRTAESVRYSEEHECKVADLPKQRHWYRTHELALILLKRLRPNLTIENSHLYFAHVNSVKCSMNNDDHRQAKSNLFKNCREYIGDEIVILKPDILVTQGKWAKVAVEKTFKVSEVPDCEQACPYHWVHLESRRALWFHTYHPRNFGKFNQQRRECFKTWAEVVYNVSQRRGKDDQ